MPADEPPLPLGPVARGFWDRHHARLRAAGLLTDADLDSFGLLCSVWGRLVQLEAVPVDPDDYRTPIKIDRALKQYQSLAKQFGLLPRDRRLAKIDVGPPARTDEFGL